MYYGGLAFEAEGDGGGGFDAYGSIETVVAVLELFDEANCVIVAAIELSPHRYNLVYGDVDY